MLIHAHNQRNEITFLLSRWWSKDMPTTPFSIWKIPEIYRRMSNTKTFRETRCLEFQILTLADRSGWKRKWLRSREISKHTKTKQFLPTHPFLGDTGGVFLQNEGINQERDRYGIQGTEVPTKEREWGILRTETEGSPGWQMCSRGLESDQVSCQPQRGPRKHPWGKKRGWHHIWQFEHVANYTERSFKELLGGYGKTLSKIQRTQSKWKKWRYYEL